MKIFFSLIVSFLYISVNSQPKAQCCASSTEAFAGLAVDVTFQSAHQLPMALHQNGVSTGEWIDFETPDGKTGRAYSIKSTIESSKYLFIFHEWWGLNANIEAEAESWAKQLKNVNILAIDLYDGKIATTREAAADLMKSADEIRIRNIIQGAINFVGSRARVATLGWCFGGGWSMQAAIMLEKQAAGCVIFYGMPEKNKDLLMGLNGKVVGIFAEKDAWINRNVVAEYEKAMREAGKPYETYWFDAEHAFANPSNSHFDEAATAKSRSIVQDFFRTLFP